MTTDRPAARRAHRRRGRRRRLARRGQCLALLALLMPVLLGFTGLTVDIGTVALANAQLKTVADAASLAGAKQLNDPARLAPNFNLSNDLAKARQRAAAIAGANRVLGQAAVVVDNGTNDPAGDVVIGYKNLAVAGSALDSSVASTALFNSVQVTARRDANHGGNVPAFFSAVMGNRGTPLSVTSTATAQNYAVGGFKCSPAGYTSLWPIALSKTTWDAMLAAQTTDNYTFKNGTVTAGADGMYESSLYPVGSGNGNWGTLRIGVSNNSTSTLAAQIQYGVSTSQIMTQANGSCNLTLGSGLGIGGNPGVRLGLKSALISRIGNTVVVPVYDPTKTTGSGSNMVYTIVTFAPVVVLSAYFNGVHSGVIVQPALISDPTAILGAPQTSWTKGGIVRLRISQ